MRRNSEHAFVPLPPDEPIRLAWPTGNHHLFTDVSSFLARTRANPDYGKPGWTRDCGKRFHRGIDIAPINPQAAGTTTTVMFTDCASGREYASDEPAWFVDEDVCAVFDGVVYEINTSAEQSTLGKYVVLQHAWPRSGRLFFSLYAHLADITMGAGSRVTSGQRIGMMGQTSASADARNWMRIAPHLHLEFFDDEGRAYDPMAMLVKYLHA